MVAKINGIPTSPVIIDESGNPVITRSNLEFTGGGVVVTDDSGNDKTIVTITSGSSGLDFLVYQVFS